MKPLLFRFLIFVIISMVSISGISQEMKFLPITEENVFDKQPVLSIDQDSKGRLWFAGESNLFTYNSRQIQNLVDTDTTFQKIGYITKIAIDRYDVLFIATSTHLYLYDIEQSRWIKEHGLPFNKAMLINAMQYIDDMLYIAAQDGLYTAQKQGANYVLKKILKREKVQCFSKKGEGEYVLASAAGIELVAFKGGNLQVIKNLAIPIDKPSNFTFSSLLVEGASLWVATKLEGLFYYDFNQKYWVNYTEKNSLLLSNNVRKVIRNDTGQLLIGTLKGLSIYQQENNIFTNYKHNALSQNTLSQNSIYDIFIDQQKTIWIGTYFGGINAVFSQDFNVQTISTRSPINKRLNSDIISCMVETNEGYWVGTEEEGLHFISKDRNRIVAIPELTSSNLIKDLFLRNDKLYIAQYAGGYSVYDISSKELTHHPLHPLDQFQLQNNVYSIYADIDENVYLGTNAGMYYVSPGKRPRPVDGLPATVVKSIKSDSKGNIYVLISGAIYQKTMDQLTFQKVSFLQDLSINGLFIDAKDNLWLSTEDKVYSAKPNADVLQVAQFKGNLLGWPIVVDDRLWVTSKQGLLCYNLKTGVSNLLNQYDGINVKNLQQAKLFLSGSKELFLITLNGLLSFFPQQVKFNTIVPTVIFDKIEVNGHKINNDRFRFNKKTQRYELKLNHDENFITIDYSSSNFIKSEKNRYRYQLEGFDKDWLESSRPEVRYTNIPQGKYTLSLFSSNNDGVWSEKPFQIDIIVLPPFWKTGWAFLLYAILVVIVLHFTIKFIVERELLLNAEDAYSKKIKFFTQISHEIRTPLTLITIPIEEIVKETESLPLVQTKVLRMQRNANKLLGIVNELLDFKKFEDGQEILTKVSIELKPYLEDFFYLFSDLALSKHLNFYIKGIQENSIVSIDSKQFDKVLFNLLSNAVKYSTDGGSIFLNVYSTSTEVNIQLADNGIGVAENKQFQIFDDYYRAENAKDTLGTGIGLALTKKIIEQHGGAIQCYSQEFDGEPFTVFHISLPIVKDYPSLSEITIAIETTNVSPTITGDILEQKTLLFVEDNMELINTIVPILKEHYNVIVARDGEEGIEVANSRVPDIILSDVMMPRMNGVEMCRIIKTNIITSHIPIILLTADNTQESQISGLRHGANIYLHKPFDTQVLIYSINNLLYTSLKKRQDFDINFQQMLPEADLQFLSKIEQLIEDNLLNIDFGVDFLSKQLGMSQPVLYKKLKAITNLSVNNFIKHYRFKKALQLLKTESNIGEVAYAIGFSDRKYFSKEFKKHFGKNPTEYIKENF